MTYHEAVMVRSAWIRGEQLERTRVKEAEAVIDEFKRKNKGDPAPIPRGVQSPMQALCECGMRYGAHRVNDYACQNPHWRPGNGQPQWLEDKFRRAG